MNAGSHQRAGGKPRGRPADSAGVDYRRNVSVPPRGGAGIDKPRSPAPIWSRPSVPGCLVDDGAPDGPRILMEVLDAWPMTVALRIGDERAAHQREGPIRYTAPI